MTKPPLFNNLKTAALADKYEFMKPDYIICHYNEIGLKGKNRKFFEERLMKNIKMGLNHKVPGSFKHVKRISGRIIVILDQAGGINQKKIELVLKNIFGIAYFAFALNVKQNISDIEKNCLHLLQDKNFKNFRISTQRSKKEYPLTSQKINEKIGAYIVEKLNKKVDLTKPDVTCFVEIVEKFAFVFLKKIKGSGGLPISTGGKAIVLLSGGIDSPVASFYVLKRGLNAVFLHFYSPPYTSEASVKKASNLVKIINKFQFKSKLYLAPFAEIQKEILINTPAKLRVVLYRRFMLRIAREIAKKEEAQAIVTGESIGQVASQTIENIGVIAEIIDLLILRPLIGFDKHEIIEQAKRIGTYPVSILPHQDCCARFLPKHPATRARLAEVEQAEKNLNISDLIKSAIKNIKLEIVN